MDVSVIIINYNTFALTCDCIQSVLDKSYGFLYEIILVDNQSTDVDAGEFVKQFPSVILVRNDINVGFAKGNNIGIARASGNYILLLNSDTVLKNNAILICKKFLDQHLDVGVVSARLEFSDGKVQHNCQRFPSVKYKVFELLRLQKFFPTAWAGKILFGSFFNHRSIAYPDWIWGTFFMFRKSLLEFLPQRKLAEDFFMYVEDVQWCMDFKRMGYQVAFEPNALVYHHMINSKAKSELIKKNTEVFMKRYYSSFRYNVISALDKWL